VGALLEPILKDEANHIRYALDTAYFVGADRQKLSYPVIRTLFVYSENNAVSFRRLTGTKGDIVEVFAKGSTTQAGGASSLLLAKSNGKIVVAELGGDSEWKAIRTEVLDCLVITSFGEGMLPEGDLLMIDTNKYRKDGQAIVHVGILAPQTISPPKVWQVRGMAFPLPDEVPVVFKRSAAIWETSIEPLLGEFSEWLNLLDQSTPDPRLSADALKFLQSVKNQLPDASFASFHKSATYKARYAMRLDQLTEAIAIAFEKK
jgi:hypothetical protein